jgi:hypothetical protein
LRAAAAAAQERLRAGILRLEDQPQHDVVPEDPIFATREFDVPPQAVAGLINWEE